MNMELNVEQNLKPSDKQFIECACGNFVRNKNGKLREKKSTPLARVEQSIRGLSRILDNIAERLIHIEQHLWNMESDIGSTQRAMTSLDSWARFEAHQSCQIQSIVGAIRAERKEKENVKPE